MRIHFWGMRRLCEGACRRFHGFKGSSEGHLGYEPGMLEIEMVRSCNSNFRKLHDFVINKPGDLWIDFTAFSFKIR